MEREYNRAGVKDFLFKQIELIDPQIIINARRVEAFFKDQIGENEVKSWSDNRFRFAHAQNRLIISAPHPNCGRSGITTEEYCNNILGFVFEEYKRD